jgi:hypothetical protein
MTQDEIIEMAREAGLDTDVWKKISDDDYFFGYIVGGIENLEAYTKLVAQKVLANHIADVSKMIAAEREACAKLCETDGRWWAERKCLMESGEAAHLASAIRARG